jgi:hypothetical protein
VIARDMATPNAAARRIRRHPPRAWLPRGTDFMLFLLEAEA